MRVMVNKESLEKGVVIRHDWKTWICAENNEGDDELGNRLPLVSRKNEAVYPPG